MDKILALLDGSAYSESVCHHTAWIAKKLNAGVEAMHVLGRREGAVSTDFSGTLRLGARSALLKELSSLDEQRAKLAQAKGHAILDDAKAILEQDGVPAVNLRLRKGDLLDALREVESDVGQDETKAKTAADEAVAKLRAASITAIPRTASGEPEEVLGHLVAEEGFNLLVMGAYGHSRIRNLIIGSTTTTMIQTVKIPVLLYR